MEGEGCAPGPPRRRQPGHDLDPPRPALRRLRDAALAVVAEGLPKQFTRLLGDGTLFQASARRLSEPGFAPPLVVTTDPLRFVAAEQLADAGLERAVLLMEPDERDTGPAVVAAALRAQAEAGDPGALVLVAPSDHVMPDVELFREAVMAVIAAAKAGRIVTFGIAPSWL